MTIPPTNDDFYLANVSKDNGTGNFVTKLDGKLPRKNSMFPKSWSTEQRVKEELSVAFTKNSGQKVSYNGWICYLSDGRKIIICIDGNRFTFDASTIIRTAWPTN